jgi:hypothetical protein
MPGKSRVGGFFSAEYYEKYRATTTATHKRYNPQEKGELP